MGKSTHPPPDGQDEVADGEHEVHAFFAGMRSELTHVSREFRARVREAIRDREARGQQRATVFDLVARSIVEALNMMSRAVERPASDEEMEE